MTPRIRWVIGWERYFNAKNEMMKLMSRIVKELCSSTIQMGNSTKNGKGSEFEIHRGENSTN